MLENTCGLQGGGRPGGWGILGLQEGLVQETSSSLAHSIWGQEQARFAADDTPDRAGPFTCCAILSVSDSVSGPESPVRLMSPSPDSCEDEMRPAGRAAPRERRVLQARPRLSGSPWPSPQHPGPSRTARREQPGGGKPPLSQLLSGAVTRRQTIGATAPQGRANPFYTWGN